MSIVVLEVSQYRRAALVKTLGGCLLFDGLSANDLQSIAGMATLRRLAKGGTLFHEGDPVNGFYVMQSGAVKVHRVNALGREQILSIFHAGKSFAEAALTDASGYPASAMAIEPSAVLLIPKRNFLELLRTRPELALRMIGSMSRHLRDLVERLDDLTLKDAETRLANWLVKHCKQPLTAGRVTVPLGCTKRVLAAELGTTSETLSRTLAKFRDQKLISVERANIIILQPLALAHGV